MEIIVIGSGTSHGVPMIGCDCEVCRSSNPRNHRFRPSILVRHEGRVILVDTTPELRLQSLAFDVRQVDAVLFTHTHADHIFGLDDLRRFNDLMDREIPVYGDAATLDDIRRIYPYIFKETQAGGGKPRLTLHAVESDFNLFGLRIRSFYVLHGKLPVLSYRFDVPASTDLPPPLLPKEGRSDHLPQTLFHKEGRSDHLPQTLFHEEGRSDELTPTLPDPARSACSVAYVTDVNYIPPDAMACLTDLDVLFLDAVRFEPHATHFGLYQALDVIAELKPRQAYLTHLSHHFEHETVNAQLPPNVALAYDGLKIRCGERGEER